MKLDQAIQMLESGAADKIISYSSNWYLEKQHIDSEKIGVKQYLKLATATDWKALKKEVVWKEVIPPSQITIVWTNVGQ